MTDAANSHAVSGRDPHGPGTTGPPPAGRRALLADGSVVVVRRLGPADLPAVRRLHEEMPLDDRYLRFFTVSRTAADHVADSIVGAPALAVGAFRAGRLLGVAHCRARPGSPDQDLAVVVARPEQARGVATLLLEHLVAVARAAGVHRLSADVLTRNHEMLAVVVDAGLPVTRRTDGDVVHLEIELSVLDTSDAAGLGYLDVLTAREARADIASLRAVLAPRSVAVIGAGRRPESVGRALLRRIVESGFTGRLSVVHPHAAAVAGISCLASVEELPAGIDLVVLCVPAAAVPDLAQRCGRRGVRALLVISAGVDTSPSGGLAAAAERHGMRVVGPNCLGLVNTDPAVRLQASFGPATVPGCVGLAVQSGGVAIALGSELGRLGLGVSSSLSMGEAIDVNADDMMMWWAQDGRTRAAVLYVESLRRPRRFAQLARRLSRRMPVLTLRSGSSAAGARAAVSHSAGSATPRVVRDALFAQAGVLAVDELSDLPGLLAVLCTQPLPAGPRVALLSNAGGAGVLATDACVGHGLTVAELGTATRAMLADLLPAGAVTANPVDATATVPAAAFGKALEVLLDDPTVDIVIALGVATAVADPLDGLAASGSRAGKPVLAVRLGQPAQVELPAAGRREPPVPVFGAAAGAARAAAAALTRSAWLRRSTVPAADPDGLDIDRARRIVADALREQPGGGWLPPEPAARLLAAAGVPVVTTDVVHDLRTALARRRAGGGPVALKADVPGLVHKGRAGAVRIGLDSARQVEQAYRELHARFGDTLRGVVVQPMAGPGAELLIGATRDPLCGPLLTFGLGGSATDVLDDRTHCLVPATDDDLDELVDGLRAAPHLYGGPRGERIRVAARDAALRIDRLAALVPELAEVEINPMVIGESGAIAVDIRARVAPAPVEDTYLRWLPA